MFVINSKDYYQQIYEEVYSRTIYLSAMHGICTNHKERQHLGSDEILLLGNGQAKAKARQTKASMKERINQY